MAEPVIINASTAPTGMSMESPPVFGSGWPSGIVSRITLSLGEVLSPELVADPAVLAPVVSAVLAPVASPLVVLVVVPIVPVVPAVVGVVVPVVVLVVLVVLVVPVVPVVLVPVVLVPVVPVVLVVLVPVVVPVVPVVLVPVGACPHAGNANTDTKVRAANIVLMYGTDSPPSRFLSHQSVDNNLSVQTMQYFRQAWCSHPSYCSHGIRTFDNSSPTPHLGG